MWRLFRVQLKRKVVVGRRLPSSSCSSVWRWSAAGRATSTTCWTPCRGRTRATPGRASSRRPTIWPSSSGSTPTSSTSRSVSSSSSSSSSSSFSSFSSSSSSFTCSSSAFTCFSFFPSTCSSFCFFFFFSSSSSSSTCSSSAFTCFSSLPFYLFIFSSSTSFSSSFFSFLIFFLTFFPCVVSSSIPLCRPLDRSSLKRNSVCLISLSFCCRRFSL